MSLSRMLPKVAFSMLLSVGAHVVAGCAQPGADSGGPPSGVSAHDFLTKAEPGTLGASDLELIYSYLEDGELALTAEDRIVPGFELRYRPRKDRRAWLEQLTSCFAFAPLPKQFASGQVTLSTADVLFGSSGLGGLSFFGARHEYNAYEDRLVLWGLDDTERDPDLMRAPAAHHGHGDNVAPSKRSLAQLAAASLSLDPVSLSRRTTRPGLFRLRLIRACTGLLERQEASGLSPSALATAPWTTSRLERVNQGQHLEVSQYFAVSGNELTITRRSGRPHFEETYRLGLDTVTVVSDLYQSLAGASEWWFNIGGGAGRSPQGSGWRVVITSDTAEAPHKDTVPVVRLAFASRAAAEAARSYFLGE